MDTILGILVGVGLAAACGFRIFVPFLVMGLAAASGHLHLASGFEWIGEPAALLLFGAATLAEILAFYLPWIDNLLDAAAQPMAMMAGVIVTAAVVTDLSPLWKWSLAIVAGGGVAGALQGGTVMARGISTVTTAGFGNFIVSTFEVVAAVIASVLAILWPLVAAVLTVIALAVAVRVGVRLRGKRSPRPA